ncbi:MAG: signal peptidase I [Clostridium paraputrificum]|uniref:signal peptidase I n=1 Tax=Clostridium sp. TaxID=1506 RepID=UPI0025BF7057|nr:signal peptidase I [Clostridium sp.]MBS5928325.1 signal peptidase I [Clostridium sp.]
MKKESKKVNYNKEVILGTILGVILIALMQRFIVIATIPSISMQPTLMVGDKVILMRNYGEVERGKVYTFEKDNEYLIKRCIAVGGDKVEIKDNDVYVNDIKLNEEYIKFGNIDKTYDISYIVPENKMFFLGDNRGASFDSREWDNPFVDKKDIIGEAKTIIYPFSRIGTLR